MKPKRRYGKGHKVDGEFELVLSRHTDDKIDEQLLYSWEGWDELWLFERLVKW